MATARSRDRDYPAPPKPRSDAWVALLGLSLAAQIVGMIFLWMDYSQYPAETPPKAAPLQPLSAGQPGK
jgi:hypothetical protein